MSSADEPVSTPAAAADAAVVQGGIVTLGLDLSTQSATGVIIIASPSAGGDQRNVVEIGAEESINFDATFPHFGTSNGVHRRRRQSAAAAADGDDAVVVTTSPVAMWLDAVDALMRRLRARHPDLVRQIAGISVSAQQHATVLVRDMSAFVASAGGADGALACPDARVWMDESTEEDRRRFLGRLEAHGGDDFVRSTTGARAELRYVAAQLMGIERLNPGLVSASTSRVHLCSSALTALISGRVDCPVDRGDASGTNLFDISASSSSPPSWSTPLIEATGLPDLAAKLPAIAADGGAVMSVGVSAWVADALFGDDAVAASCRVVVGTGDNPASLVGCFASGPADRVASVSLGTSDTVCVAASDAASVLRASSSASTALTASPLARLARLAASPCVMGNAQPGDESVLVMACLTSTGGAIARESLARLVLGQGGGGAIDHVAVENEAWRCLAAAEGSSLLAAALVEVDHLLEARRGEGATPVAGDATLRYVGLVLVQAACLALSIRGPGHNHHHRETIFVTGGGSRSLLLCCLHASVFGASTVRRLRRSGNTAALGAAIKALQGSRGSRSFSTAPSAGLAEELDVARTIRTKAGPDAADKVRACLGQLLHGAASPVS